MARVSAKAAAYLDAAPDEKIRHLPFDAKPYWHIERARVGDTRRVPVEVVVNGLSVAKKEIVADGSVQDLQFEVSIERSSWIALRILPSSHTNPIFVPVNGRPIRASRRSAAWCLAAVKQCWSQKRPKIAPQEVEAARQAYEKAEAVYQSLLAESDRD